MEPNPKQALALWRMLTAETPEIAEPTLSNVKPRLTPKERQQLVDGGYVSERDGANRAKHLILEDRAWQWAGTVDAVRVYDGLSDVGAETLQALLRFFIPFMQRETIPLADVLRGDPVPLVGGAATPGKAEPSRRSKKTKQTATKRKATAKKTAAKKTAAKKTAAKKTAAKKVRTKTKPKAGGTANVQAVQADHSTRSAPAAVTPHDRVLSTIRSLATATSTGAVRIATLRTAVKDMERPCVDRALRALRDAGLVILYQDDDRASLTQADHEAALMEAATPRHLVYLENQ